MAAPPRFCSSLNPFDSDDDDLSPSPSSSTHANSNSLRPPRSREAATRAGLARQELRQNGATLSRHQQPIVRSLNPFDDDEPTVKPKNGSSDGRLDECPKPPAAIIGEGYGQRILRSSRSQSKEHVAESGEAAVKNCEKSNDSGAKQASKLRRQEPVKQARKSEERSYAFKSKDARFELKSSKPNSQSSEKLVASELDIKYGGSNDSAPRHENNQYQGAYLEHTNVQELEGYALQKSEDLTESIQNSLKLAESIRGDAERTLITLHGQGEQIRRTHERTLDIDQSLYAGEQLLGSLGGMFSKTWKPQKGRSVTGPALVFNDSFSNQLKQRAALGLESRNRKGLDKRSSLNSEAQSHQQTTLAKLEMEKAKQDDALSDLSNVLDQLKEMSVDMGSEISRQTIAMDHLHDDITSLDERVKSANRRSRRLLGHE